jgi:hypothetical protein
MNKNKTPRVSLKRKETPKSYKDSGLDSSHHKWGKWASIATVAGVFVAIVALFLQKEANNLTAEGNKNKDSAAFNISIINTSTIVTDPIKKKSDRTVAVQDTSSTQKNADRVGAAKFWNPVHPIVKPSTTTILQTENLWDSQLENRLHKILTDRTGKNIRKIAGSLVLSDPDKTRGNGLRYTLTLTIDFFTSSSKKSCGQAMYRSIVETDAADTKDRILLQGLDGHDGIFVKIQQDNSLPSCINL